MAVKLIKKLANALYSSAYHRLSAGIILVFVVHEATFVALAIKTIHCEPGPQQLLLAVRPSEPPNGMDEKKISFRLDANRLKYIEIIPMLIEHLERWDLEQAHRQELFVVLSELYNNALDHGILGLDSRMKSEIDGFIAYMERRESLLSTLRDGLIEIEIERVCKESKAYVKLRVKDSGRGFRFNKVFETPLNERRRHAGRGIALVKTLCNGEIQYLGSGNEVVAFYAIKKEGEFLKCE